MTLNALRTKRLEALPLDTIVIAGLVGVDVAEQFDGFQLHSCVGVA
jgi:hypothetical protein